MAAKILTLAALLLCVLAASESKISPQLTNLFQTTSEVDIIVTLKESCRPILEAISNQPHINLDAKRQAIYQALETFTTAQQQEILHYVQTRSSSHQIVQGFWITNVISIRRADQELVQDLESKFGAKISDIRPGLVLNTIEVNGSPVLTPKSELWNIQKIRAPEAWELGYSGANITVASCDTGVLYTHEALNSNYRADYGWFDPYEGTEMPIDALGVGTHNMGVMVGTNHGIGVAPQAQWIACRGCSTASCSEFALLGCGQWAICPTLPDGSNADCSKSPRVVSNNWGGGRGNPWYNDVIAAMREANVVPVFPIGGSGPTCGTANSPADQSEAVGIGAIGADSNMTSFSSRGPSVDGRVKPDLVAPGTNIYSAYSTTNTSYVVLSGSASASAHIGGAVAVVLSKDPSLNVTEVLEILYDTANKPNMSEIPCNGTEWWPNNEYGHGIIDVYEAVMRIRN